MANDISSASYESGRRALQLAVDGDSSSIQEIASLLVQEAEDHKNSSLECTHERGVIRCDHHTAFEAAASAGDMDAVERLLAAGADPNAPIHEKGISALEAAAAHGRLIVVKKLLETGAHPDHRGECSETTPLIAAAMAGHIQICEALLQSGADVGSLELKEMGDSFSAIEAAGETLNVTLLELFLGVVEDAAKEFDPDELEVAIAEGRQKDSRRLLRTKGFLDRARASINHALVEVASTGSMIIIQRLLDAGADITGPGSYRPGGCNPNAIAAAASGGQLEAMNKLLQAAADRNVLTVHCVTNALQSAVNAGSTALIGPLLQVGADPTRIDIRRAAAKGHIDVLASILQSGALIETTQYNSDVDIEWRLAGFTALQLAADHGHLAVVDLLLAKGADANNWGTTENVIVDGERGGTALQLAVARGHSAVTKRLIDGGADVNMTCQNSSDTALQAAIRTGNTAVLELLLAAGADVDAAVPWALQEAAENGHVDIVRELLQVHPDINMRLDEKRQAGKEELTFLQTAAANGNLEVLEILLSEGADVNLNPSGGWQPTALQSASERGDLAAVELLLAAGAEVNVTGSTAPPLLLAIQGDHVQAFEYLLAAGADIHATAYRGQTMLEAADDSGGADILDRVRAALHSRPPPPVDQPLDRGTGPLCETCRLTPLDKLFRSDEGNQSEFVLHPSLTALRASAAAGCPFCCFLWKRLGITTISIPQPSPVIVSLRRQNGVCCHVREPFPRHDTAAEHLSAEFPIFLPSNGEISLGAVSPLLKQ
ncbi:ankyrin repeat-containing domain protein [Diaporthe sp. PMI_573]|nr:ankyrin repeat-containing domain protein [Diaporthaceae sp. PMI_573]